MFKVKPNEDKTLEWWYQNRHKIDMAPTYQRHGSLWKKDKKAKLIDSILNDYDMPKLYLADFNYQSSKLNQKQRPFAVIDGKQRLETIFEFFEGKIPLPEDFQYLPAPDLKIAGMNYLELQRRHPKIADKIAHHIPSIMSVVGDDEDRIDELFVRLNSGLPANSAERRNAMPGLVPQIIRHLVSRDFFKNNIRFNVSRMGDHALAVKLLITEYNETFVSTNAKNLDAFVKIGINPNGKRPVLRRAEAKASEVLDIMAGIFQKRDPLLSASGIIPLYYWLVRSHPRDTKSIRPFIVEFTKELVETKKLYRINPDKVDKQMLVFYTRQRTGNDPGSLNARYASFEKQFLLFKKNLAS